VDAIVPWLSGFPAKQPKVVVEGRASKPEAELKLARRIRALIGCTFPWTISFAENCRRAKIITVSLDPTAPIPGHACAWEMLMR